MPPQAGQLRTAQMGPLPVPGVGSLARASRGSRKVWTEPRSFQRLWGRTPFLGFQLLEIPRCLSVAPPSPSKPTWQVVPLPPDLHHRLPLLLLGP